ncbi:hypothetical protein XENOCAPTIV_001473, partial [Xenoophorus captivus]
KVKTDGHPACFALYLDSYHGHNQLVAYSRAAYFCIFCALIWLLEQLLRRKDLPVSTLYGVTIICYDVLSFVRDALVGKKESMRVLSF